LSGSQTMPPRKKCEEAIERGEAPKCVLMR
jgi:hypothetical protein